MKSLRAPAWSGSIPSTVWRTAAMFCGLLILVVGFWTALLPPVLAREATASDMIAEQLPGRKTLKSATKSEFLGAVCAAVRKRRSASAAITQAAVVVRRESAADIVGAVLRCNGKTNCELVGSVVAAATAGEGDSARITDAATAKAPNCAETIREASRRGAKASDRAEAETSPEQGPLIGTSSGPDEGFDPHEQLNLVCDKGTQRAVRASQLDDFLRSNPGSFVGVCQPTPQKPH
jgi:hypothetical protein